MTGAQLRRELQRELPRGPWADGPTSAATLTGALTRAGSINVGSADRTAPCKSAVRIFHRLVLKRDEASPWRGRLSLLSPG